MRSGEKRKRASNFGMVGGGHWQASAAVPDENGALQATREKRAFVPVLTVEIASGVKTLDRMQQLYPWWSDSR